MASGDLSHQSPAFLVQFGKEVLGQNAGLVDNRTATVPVQQLEIHPRQWMPDGRDAFISWLRGEFAAANAIIDAMCQHLHMIGQPAEYDFVLTCIQQRRYNWTLVLHMQQYFSVAEVVHALQQVAWRKQQSQSSDLPRAQQARRIVDDSKDARTSGVSGELKSEAASSFPRTDIPVPDDTVGSVNPSRVVKTANLSRDGGTGQIPIGEGSQSPTPEVGSSGEPLLPRSDLAPAYESIDPNGSNSAPQNVPKLTAKQDVQNEPAKECSSSHSKSQDSGFPYSKKIEVLQKGRNLSGLGSRVGRAKSLDSGPKLLPDVYNTSHGRMQSAPMPIIGKNSNIEFNLPSKEEEAARFSMVKVSKQFQYWEQADGNTINVVEGLELYENVLNNIETSQLASLVTDLQAEGRQGEMGGQTFITDNDPGAGRLKQTIQLGHAFSPTLGNKGHQGGSVEPMPQVFQSLIDRLVRWHVLPANKRLDCCTINILEEGDHSAPHKHYPNLERYFCCLSLLSECTLVLGQNISMEQQSDCKGRFRITLNPGSALILQGNSVDIASRAILASPGKRIMVTFGKALSTSKASNANLLGSNFALTTPTTVVTIPAWSPAGQQGFGGTSGSGKGLVPTVIKQHGMATAPGVLPAPYVRSSAHVPQQIHQHLATPNAAQPLFTNPTGPAGSYPTVGVMGQGWSAVPQPSRPPSTGTGVFFPSSGSSSGASQPMGALQAQTGLILLPNPHKSDSLVAFPSTSEACNFAYPSNRLLRRSTSADQIAANASQKLDANVNRNTKDEHQQRVFHRPKTGAASKFNQ